MSSAPVVIPREQIQLFLRARRTLLLVPRGEESGGNPPYRAGARIGLQPKASKRATIHVEVRRVTDVALAELTDDDARELGHKDLTDLRDAWAEEHGQWDAAARAWRLAVEIDPREQPRLLTAQSGRHGRRALQQYTTENTLAIHDAGEAVDEFATAAAGRAAHATEHERFQLLLEHRRQLPLDERLRLAINDAKTRSIPVDSDIRLITRKIGDIEDRVYRPADRLLT